jgi:hypothetical protein
MAKNANNGCALPRLKPITEEELRRAIGAENLAASGEHRAQEAWFDSQHGIVMIRLTDGRAFGAEPSFIPSLRGASREQLEALRASEDGVYLVVTAIDLHISVDGLVARIVAKSQ